MIRLENVVRGYYSEVKIKVVNVSVVRRDVKNDFAWITEVFIGFSGEDDKERGVYVF